MALQGAGKDSVSVPVTPKARSQWTTRRFSSTSKLSRKLSTCSIEASSQTAMRMNCMNLAAPSPWKSVPRALRLSTSSYACWSNTRARSNGRCCRSPASSPRLPGKARGGHLTRACSEARRGSGAVRAGRADAANEREPERRRERIDAEREAEHIDFEALDAACQHAEQAEHRQLEAAAARRRREQPVAEIVLADCSRRQVQPELGHRAGDVRGKGIGIGSCQAAYSRRRDTRARPRRFARSAHRRRRRAYWPGWRARCRPSAHRASVSGSPPPSRSGASASRSLRRSCKPSHPRASLLSRYGRRSSPASPSSARRTPGRPLRESPPDRRQADRRAARRAPIPRCRARHDGCTEAAERSWVARRMLGSDPWL